MKDPIQLSQPFRKKHNLMQLTRKHTECDLTNSSPSLWKDVSATLQRGEFTNPIFYTRQGQFPPCDLCNGIWGSWFLISTAFRAGMCTPSSQTIVCSTHLSDAHTTLTAIYHTDKPPPPPQQTQNIFITFVQCWTNAGWRCTNDSKMFCVCWAALNNQTFETSAPRRSPQNQFF